VSTVQDPIALRRRVSADAREGGGTDLRLLLQASNLRRNSFEGGGTPS